jgi:chromosome segregation ATPase
MGMSDSDCAHMLTSLDNIEAGMRKIEAKVDEFDKKLDDTAVTIGKYGERIDNNKAQMNKIEADHRESINILHTKIRHSREESAAESHRENEKLALEQKEFRESITTKIDTSREQATTDAVRITKNWTLTAVILGIFSIIGTIGTIISLISKLK